jgi:two-component system response regulator VicR
LLSDTEYRLLSYLARNAGRIVTRDQILERIWSEEYVGEDHLLHVTIGRLRQKLEDPARKPRYILTRRGIGYSFPLVEECSEYPVGLR